MERTKLNEQVQLKIDNTWATCVSHRSIEELSVKRCPMHQIVLTLYGNASILYLFSKHLLYIRDNNLSYLKLRCLEFFIYRLEH